MLFGEKNWMWSSFRWKLHRVDLKCCNFKAVVSVLQKYCVFFSYFFLASVILNKTNYILGHILAYRLLYTSVQIGCTLLCVGLNVHVCSHIWRRKHIYSCASEPRELTERTWLWSYLPHIAVWQSLGARRPFISQSAPQLTSGPANREPHTPSPLLSSVTFLSPSPPPLSLAFCRCPSILHCVTVWHCLTQI